MVNDHNGVEIEKQDAPAIVKRDLHLLFNRERRITPQEVKEWPKLPPPQKQHVAQNMPPPTTYKSEPSARDITMETAFDLAGARGLLKGGWSAARYAMGSIAAKQAAARTIRFSSVQLQRKYKHAAKWGLPRNYTPQNAGKFAKILEFGVAFWTGIWFFPTVGAGIIGLLAKPAPKFPSQQEQSTPPSVKREQLVGLSQISE